MGSRRPDNLTSGILVLIVLIFLSNPILQAPVNLILPRDSATVSIPPAIQNIFGSGSGGSGNTGIDGLHVDGSEIKNALGQTVVLRGFHMDSSEWIYGFGDREPYAPQSRYDAGDAPFTQAHLDQIASWGANIITVNVWWTGYSSGARQTPSEPNINEPYVYNLEGLSRAQELIRMANRAGLYVNFQVRVCYDPTYVASGGYPHYGYVLHDDVVLDRVDPNGIPWRDRYYAYLEWITENIVSMPNVVTFEPWHFPYHRQAEARTDPGRYNPYFDEVVPAIISSIRKHTDKIIIICPPVLGHFDYSFHPGKYEDNNLVYGTGGYGKFSIMRDPAVSWDYDENTVKDHPHDSWERFQSTYDVPIMSTEGPGMRYHAYTPENGGRPLPQDKIDLLEYLFEEFDRMNGWIWWCYSEGDIAGILEQGFPPGDPRSEGELVELVKTHLR